MVQASFGVNEYLVVKAKEGRGAKDGASGGGGRRAR